MSHELPNLGTRALERLFAASQAVGDLDGVYRRNSDAWQLTLPDLTSLPAPEGERRPIKVCIATEDIVGPVRNGGIGTTYAALAELLAGDGHDVTVLYLRRAEVENETIQHWISVYANKGVRFVPVPSYARAAGLDAAALRWLEPMYNLFHYLQEHPMDVVHASEWRGAAFLSLLAKRQGLGLQSTLFIIKTSSPWLWNRLYGSLPLDQPTELALTYAERRSVELADMVIGGSLHLIRWMAAQGYDIPRNRSFVQPNVARFDHLAELMKLRTLQPGTRLPIEEIVFFGRLEARKGLLTFCQAIRRLLRQGHALPRVVSFMGKKGARLGVRGGQTALDYIRSETADWPCEVRIHTEFQQYQALDYLLAARRLAVMPSLIENSSLAVYEATLCHIPFIASLAGGTPELIATIDHDRVLCDPHPIPLAGKLADAIDNGGWIARPSFDNDDNLMAWRTFHDGLARGLAIELLARAARETKGTPDQLPSIDICIYSRGDVARLAATLQSLTAQAIAPDCVRIGIDAPQFDSASTAARNLAHEAGLRCLVIDASDYDAGLAGNALAATSSADYLLFLAEGAKLDTDALPCLRTITARRAPDVLTYFYRLEEADGSWCGPLVAEMIGSPAEMLLSAEPVELPLLVRRQFFLDLEGFTTDYRVLMHEREFVAKAILAKARCETVPRRLGTLPPCRLSFVERHGYDTAAAEFRTVRPYVAAAPLALREILLMTARRHSVRRSTLLGTALPDDAIGVQSGDAHSSVRQYGDLLAGWGGPQAEDGAHFAGRVLAVRDGVVMGWVQSRLTRSQPVVVEAWADGKRLSACTADLALDLACEVPDAVANCGFSLPIPSLARRLASARNQRPMIIDIVCSGGACLARQLRVFATGTPIDRTPFVGHCDANDVGAIMGWLWEPGAPHRAFDVAVFLDGRFLNRIEASSFRADLRDAGIGHGGYAFSTRLPHTCYAGGRYEIDLIVADHGPRLINAPLTVEGTHVTSAPRTRGIRWLGRRGPR